MEKIDRVSVEGRPMVDTTEPGLKISRVLPEGIGQAVGLKPGDLLETINGAPIRDPIDYRFHVGEEEIEVTVRSGDEIGFYEIEKDLDEDLGLEFEDMPILKCNNKCVFCFLHQMPKGMRKTLYYQDDDYRLSFLHGAYVTLTNLSDDEFQRILEQRLSPMYISVHATDPEVRGELLGRRGSSDVLERIDFLAENGIQMHAQVVLCPGLNDGAYLKQTIFDLAERYPHVESVGVVPLGLTKFRKNLPSLEVVTPEISRVCINQVDEWQALFKQRLDTRFVYLGDEFYLQADRAIPASENYDGFPLVENGIGMVRRFVDTFAEQVTRLPEMSGFKLILVTGMLGPQFLQDPVDRLNRIPGLSARLISVVNHFLGEGITVSGLLTGQDILKALSKSSLAADERVILPPNCINHDGILLDDLAPKDLSEKLGCSVSVGTYNLVETVLQQANRSPERVRVRSEEIAHPYISSHQVSC
ncbi:MAG: DUF512 domain-containing protein [bacterium]|nr:DUF512 domain-containing protein [bacterium]